MKCENCGQELQEDMRFCIKCGSPVEKKQNLRCKECGASVDPGAVFCDHCGAPIQTKRRKMLPVILVLAISALLIISAIVFATSNKDDQKSSGIENSPMLDSVLENEDGNSDGSTSYTIISKDTDGITLDSTIKQGIIGQAITETANRIDGYVARNGQQSIILSSEVSENIIVFLYEHAEEQSDVEYSVICVDNLSGEILQKKVYLGKIGEDISCYAPSIEGYNSDYEKLTITLSEIDTENVLYFYYETVEEESNGVIIPSDNTLHYNGHTYYVIQTSNINSFWEAQNYCEKQGGYLAVINDDNENKALYDYVFKDMGYRSAYFGFTDEGSEGDWYWAGYFDFSSYTNWLNGQPDNKGNKEHYALFYYKDTPYKWNDGDFGKDTQGTVSFLIEWNVEQ